LQNGKTVYIIYLMYTGKVFPKGDKPWLGKKFADCGGKRG
jgi:hypothetical protein